MSDTKKPYCFAMGMVQAFVKNGVKQPAVRTADTNGGQVHNIVIKTNSQAYLDVAIWENSFPGLGAGIQEGTVIFVDGPYEESQGNNGQTFRKITASRIAGVPGKAAVRNDVVNPVQQPAAMQAQTAPVAQPAAPAAAPQTTTPFTF